MRDKKVLGKVVLGAVIVCVMAGGAWGIYTLKHEYPIERIEEMLSSNIADVVDDVVADVKENIKVTIGTVSENANVYDETTLLMQVNAGGEIDNSDLTEQEKGYEEYIEMEQESTTVKEKDTTVAPTEPTTAEEITTTTVKVPETTTRQPETTTVKEREATPAPTTTAKERETTPAPTTTTKKQGKVVTDEKIRAAMIQLGYDPDNYIASDLTTAEITAILRLARGEATSVPAERMEDAVDYSQRNLEYDGPELPKPMG